MKKLTQAERLARVLLTNDPQGGAVLANETWEMIQDDEKAAYPSLAKAALWWMKKHAGSAQT